ncbi:MAG TPA: hypothetical protein VJV23_12705 [Candidatus Polarisedimenticolia bacterium]|nr:hypothetical protein [Candidatus Polarisedimenticolia bacterium]
MNSPDTFQEIRKLFGRLDDLCQQRKRSYTGWVSGSIDPAAFGSVMKENLAATREAAEELLRLLSPPA